MYYFIVMINIFGAIYAMMLLTQLLKHYVISQWMGWYVFFSFAGMLYLAITQIYYLTMPPTGDPKIRLAATLWWGPKVFLVWALKYSSLKKRGDGTDIRYTTENNQNLKS